MEFAYDGGGLGKSRTATLYVNGQQDYGPRNNEFNGRVKGFEIAIAETAASADHLVSPEDAVRIAFARQ